MKKILVTGAAGFIGSHLCEALLRRGDIVTGLDNFDPFYPEAIKRNNIKNILNDNHFSFFENSIFEEDKLEKIFDSGKFTHVVHLAAKAGVRPSIQYPMSYQKYNVEATSIMLELSSRYKIENFIFASSSSVYGNNKKVPFSETDNVDFPISPYAATKKAGELLCYTYHHLYKMKISALRFFTVYGPRQRPEMAIHKFTRLIDEGNPVPVYGFGKPERDFTYIDDILQGILKSIDLITGYEIYNLGESNTISTNKLIGLIENSLGKKAIREKMPMQPGDVNKTFADINKANNKLGYNPTTRIEDGIVKFVEWYLDSKKK